MIELNSDDSTKQQAVWRGYTRAMRFPLLLAAAVLVAPFQTRSERLHGGWSARAGETVFFGEWACAAPCQEGTWTLLDAQGRRLAGGAWAVRKAEQSWYGTWSAAVPGGKTHTGTWEAESSLDPNGTFLDLLRSSAKKDVQGSWTSGNLSGEFALRATPQAQEK